MCKIRTAAACACLLLAAVLLFSVTVTARAESLAEIEIVPGSVELGTVFLNSEASQNIKIYNTDNATALNYMIAVRNLTGITTTPAAGAISPKSNATVNVHLAADAKPGNYTGSILVNGTATESNGSVSILPARSIRCSYQITNQSAIDTPPLSILESGAIIGHEVEIFAAVLIVLAVFVGANYWWFRRDAKNRK